MSKLLIVCLITVAVAVMTVTAADLQTPDLCTYSWAKEEDRPYLCENEYFRKHCLDWLKHCPKGRRLLNRVLADFLEKRQAGGATTDSSVTESTTTAEGYN